MLLHMTCIFGPLNAHAVEAIEWRIFAGIPMIALTVVLTLHRVKRCQGAIRPLASAL